MVFLENLIKSTCHIFSKNTKAKKSNFYFIFCHMSLHKTNKQFSTSRIMPKAVTQEVIEARLKNSQNKSIYPPSEIYLCVLGNGGNSCTRALYMFTDHGRYLFNCGEGTQRLAHEYKMKLAKLDNIFITHKSWENVGGLLGLTLTVQDIGVPEINLHGPPDIELLFENAKSFAYTEKVKFVKKNDIEKSFSDTCMEVRYIQIVASKDQEFTESNSGVEEYWNVSENKSKKLRLSNRRSYPDMTVAYVCKGHKKLGRLSIEKCVEQGVPPGPLLGDLKSGKDVTLPSGKIICSKDVVSPEEPCPLFLVVECPSKEFIDQFVNEEKFRNYQKNGPELSEIASLVVHFTPPDILQHEKYQEWMQRFSKETCHLVINSDNATLGSAAVHRIQYQLNLLHPEIFPLLQEKEVNSVKKENMAMNIIQANTLDRYYLRPAKGIDRSCTVSVDSEEFIKEAMDMEGFKEKLYTLKESMKQSLDLFSDSEVYPEVTFLGTGSCIPSKVRNVSSILVESSKDRYLLMDCGEGTYIQLTRIYGHHHITVLSQMFCIFVSHMHADHHMGLIQLLKLREKAFKDVKLQYVPVLIIGPSKLKPWLTKYHRTFECISHLYTFVECCTLVYDNEKLLQNEKYSEYETSVDIKIRTVPVDHCFDAYGIVLTQKDSKWKLVYSGDTMPCEILVIPGKNCTLLIHEATMEDDLVDEAFLKKHSITSDAIKIGEKMNSDYTILTHFSQRYAKVPIFNENFHNHVGCAFDNMKVSQRTLHIIPLLIPVLKCLFAEYMEEMHAKGNKRRKKLELKKSLSASSVGT